AIVKTIRKRARPDIIREWASSARSSGMVSTIAATSLMALNRSVASPAFGVPVRAPSTPSCLNSNSNADTSMGSSEAAAQDNLGAASLLQGLGDIGGGTVDVAVPCSSAAPESE